MKPKQDQIWLALVTAIFLNASLLDSSAQPGSLPILTLPNGVQLLFAGTTYGTTNTPPSPEKYIGLPGTLWPDEPAWRLKLELKRKTGFAPEEFVTFKNVPVPKKGVTDFTPLTNIVGGVQPVLKQFVENGDRTSIRYPRGTNANYFVVDRTPETMVAVELPGHPEGVVVDFVKMVADTDEIFEEHGNTWGPFYRAASLRFIPPNVKTVDITWVVQKTRSVEFLVKPPTSE